MKLNEFIIIQVFCVKKLRKKEKKMNREEIFVRINKIFRNEFDEDSLIIGEETTAAVVEGWDSLMHISLIEAIEDEFNMRFSMLEVNGMKNVGEMVSIIEGRIK